MIFHKIIGVIASILGIGNLSKSFNLDISNARIYRGPNGSMFGFSVALHRDLTSNISWLLVGAPKAETGQSRVRQGGGVFRCQSNHHECEMVSFDKTGNNKIGNREVDFKSEQFFGATLKSSDDDSVILACAPLYAWRTTNKQYFNEPERSKKKNDQPVGTCFTSKNSFTEFAEYSPCRTILIVPYALDTNQGYGEFGFCQVGFGADLSKDGRQAFIGAVGSNNYRGELIALVNSNRSDMQDEKQAEKIGNYQFIAPPGHSDIRTGQRWPTLHRTAANMHYNYDGYLGYSVATGEFNGDSISDVVAGMPRGQHLTGMVIVFSSDLVQIQSFYGNQIGEYFGFSLCVLDVNGDGLDDIAIGAPMFTDYKENGDEIGRVYIYYQTKTRNFDKNDKLDGHEKFGRFGSLSSVGDLNSDGFDDLAVGAPYAGLNGQGAIYIYNGGSNGIKQKYSQVIYGSEFGFKTFGFSISGGKDLDGNGYPDILVGAYESDSVAYFRSVPAIRVDIWLTFPNGNIDLNNKGCTLKSGIYVTCFPIQLCMRYKGHMISQTFIDLKTQVILDYKKISAPRMFLLENEEVHTFSKIINLNKSNKNCLDIQLYVPEGITDKKTSFNVDIRYSAIVTDSNKRLPFVIDAERSTLTNEWVLIKRNCGPDNICITDLGLKILPSHIAFTSGSASQIWIEIEVENYRDDSYGSMIFIEMPTGLSYRSLEISENQNSIPILCSTPKVQIVRCEIGDPLPSTTRIKFKLFFQTNQIVSTKSIDKMSYEFRINVNSTDSEEILDNNVRQVSIQIQIQTKLEVVGFSRPNSIMFNTSLQESILNENNIGPEIIHSYEIKCGGPSSIEEAIVEILWPSLTNNGRPLLYLLEQPIVEGPGNCDFVEQVNPHNVTTDKKLLPSRNALVSEDSDQEYKAINQTQGIYEQCENNQCIRIRCHVGQLTFNGQTNVVIHLKGQIYSDNLLSSKGLNKLSIKSKLIGHIVYLPYNVSTRDFPYVEVETQTLVELNLSASIPWWAYLLIVVGGSLILLLLSFMLYKSGFFKRIRHPKTQEATSSEEESINSNKEPIEDISDD